MMNNSNEGLADASAFLSRTMVVLPALNEFSCVAATVQAWQTLGAGGVRVVDNGSSDDTAGAARKACAQVLVEPVRGYGAAAWRGLQDWPADMDWVLFSSADGSDRLSEIELREWQAAVDAGADLIVGDRVKEKASRAELTFTQRLGNWITCEAIRVGWSKRFHDLGSLRLARHRRLMSLGLADRGFGWNVEMQIRAIEHGWKIVELPVRYFPRQAGESKISGNLLGSFRAGSAILRMLGLLWMLRRRRPDHSVRSSHSRNA